jgi:hypothetical protein
MGQGRSRGDHLRVNEIPPDVQNSIRDDNSFPMMNSVSREMINRNRASRRRASAAGMRGLEPGASPEDIRATYLWGAENDRNTERRLRPNFPQPDGARTQSHRGRVTRPFVDDGFYFSQIKQGSRQPQDIAAVYRSMDATGGSSVHVARSNPALVRPSLDLADDHYRRDLIHHILHMHSESRDDQLRRLADRSLAAAIRTPDNPGGVEASDVFDNVLARGSPEMVRSLVPHLPDGYVAQNRQHLRGHLVYRGNTMANKKPGDEQAVRAMFPDGYFDPVADSQSQSDTQ